MNFIKIKDDYINLGNVTDIRISEHEVMFFLAIEDVFIRYQDYTQDENYRNRKLTTEELEQLKGDIRINVEI